MTTNDPNSPEKDGIRVKVPVLVGACAAVAAIAVGATLMLRPAAQTTNAPTSSAPVAGQEQVRKVLVPSVVGLERQHACKAIANALLDVGTKTEEYSDTVPDGNVISQDPAPGTAVEAESKVNLVISKGKKAPAEVTMPNLMGMTRREAEQALRDAKLVAVQDTMVVTSQVEPGHVCKQSVKAGTKVKEDTHVSYALALADTRVAVPNLVGMSLNDAGAALKKAGLGEDTTYEYNNRVEKNRVIRQSVAAGNKVAKGTVVTLAISLGAKPTGSVEVPDVRGKNVNDATSAIQAAGLKADVVREYNKNVGKDNVIDQSIAAGTKVDKGTTITIGVSLGAKPEGSIAVPDLSNMMADDAQQALANAGLTPDRDEAYSDEVEKDHVMGQSLEAGTKVAKGTQVTYTVSLGKRAEPEPVQKTTVPDIMTYTLDDAISAIKSAGLVERWSGEENGTVIAQDPPAGTEVDAGSTVTFTLEHRSSKVEVPDVSGMSADDASAKMESVGLVLDYDHNRGSDELEGTDPVAGALVDEGETVVAVFRDNTPVQSEPEQQPEQQPEPEQKPTPEQQPEPEQQPAPEQPKDADNGGTDQTTTGSDPTDADRKIFKEAMEAAQQPDYELVSKLSARGTNDGCDYTYLCRRDGENYKAVIHESGVDGSTATLVTVTKAEG